MPDRVLTAVTVIMNDVAPPTQTPGELRFGLLGPVRAERGGREVGLGGVKQRGLLAALLSRPGQVVTMSALIDDVWGPNAPASAAQMVKVIVSRLRSALGDPDVIQTATGGYRMDVSVDQLDVLQAKAALVDARSSRPARERAGKCAAALALWRGEALADLSGIPLAEISRPALAELRRSILDARISALLEAGMYEDALLESRAETAARPLDDAAHGRLMHALYLAGRQADALTVYAEYRRRLADELGVEPGPGLTDLHQRLLRQDPTLSASGSAPLARSGAAGAAATSTGPARAVELPSQHGPKRRHRRYWAIAATAVAVSAAAAAAVVLSDNPRHVALQRGVVLRADSVAEFDANTGAITADIPVGAQPGLITVDGGYAWIASDTQHTITAISTAASHAATTYGLPTTASSLTPGPGEVWVGLGFDGRLARILIASQELTTPFFPTRPVHGLVAATTSGTNLWVATTDGRLSQLDGRSLELRDELKLTAPARAIVLSDGDVWSIDLGQQVLRRTALNGRSAERLPIRGNVQAIGAGFGSVWALTTSPNALLRLDETGRVQHTYALTAAASWLCVGADAIWTATRSSGALIREDPTGDRPAATFQLAHPIGGIACDGRQIWVTLD